MVPNKLRIKPQGLTVAHFPFWLHPYVNPLTHLTADLCAFYASPSFVSAWVALPPDASSCLALSLSAPWSVVTFLVKLFLYCAAVCLVARSCQTLFNPMDCSPPGSSVHGDPPGKNTGVGCHALLQGIFPTQGLNPGFPYCKWILYCLSHQGSPTISIYSLHTHYHHINTFYYFTHLCCLLPLSSE